MLTVQGLSEILITPYEELHLWLDGSHEIDEEFRTMRTMAEDIGDGGLLAPYADCHIDTADSYYSGDHMVLELYLSR